MKDPVETRGRPRTAIYDKFCLEILEAVEKEALSTAPRGTSCVVSRRLSKSSDLVKSKKKHRCFYESVALKEVRTFLRTKNINVSVFYRNGISTVKASKS